MTDDSATPSAGAGPDPDQTRPDTAPAPTPDPLRGSLTSGIWVSVVGVGVVLVLLIVFIAQNTQTVNVSFFAWDGRAPLAVTLLIATTAGLFLAAVAGSLRILQLRRRVRRENKR
jgi:uncharacterized integral membrane protein